MVLLLFNTKGEGSMKMRKRLLLQTESWQGIAAFAMVRPARESRLRTSDQGDRAQPSSLLNEAFFTLLPQRWRSHRPQCKTRWGRTREEWETRGRRWMRTGSYEIEACIVEIIWRVGSSWTTTNCYKKLREQLIRGSSPALNTLLLKKEDWGW